MYARIKETQTLKNTVHVSNAFEHFRFCSKYDEISYDLCTIFQQTYVSTILYKKNLH